MSPSAIMAASASRLRASEAPASSSSSSTTAGGATTEETPKLKFLANLTRPSLGGKLDGAGSGGGGGGGHLDPLDAADYAPGGILDPLSDYPHPIPPSSSSSFSSSSSAAGSSYPGRYDTHSPLYLPLSSSGTYASNLGSLVSERERERNDPVVRAGGFKADEVFEKAIREAVMGLWEKPKGWGASGAGAGEGEAAAAAAAPMQVDVGA